MQNLQLRDTKSGDKTSETRNSSIEGVKMSEWIDLIPKPRSKFLFVKCSDCGNEQVVFGNASIIVRCNVCEGILAEPTGGRAKIHGEILDIYD